MSNDQITGLLQQVLPILSGIAIALGWLTSDEASYWTATILKAAGPVMLLAGIIWSVFFNSKTSITKSIAAMPETSVVPGPAGSAVVTIHDTTLASSAMAAATPQSK